MPTIPNFPSNARTYLYNTYDLYPEGDVTADTTQWVALVNAINANVPAGKTCQIRIRDNAKSLKLSTAVDTDGSQSFDRGVMIFGETMSSRIEFTDGYNINFGGYYNPIDLSATMPADIVRGTMSAMPARTNRILSPNISLSRGDWVLVWSYDDIPLTEVAPHIPPANKWPITMTGTGGTYTVTINGSTSASIAYNDSIGTIQTKLEGISGVGSGNVLAGGTPGFYYITMAGTLSVPTNTISVSSSLTGGTVTIGTDIRGRQRSAELHRVEYDKGSDYVLDGFVVDPLTTSAQLAKIGMLRNSGFRNLTIGSTGVTDANFNDHINYLSVQRCLGFVMEDVRVDETGAGGTIFQLCADSYINNYSGTYHFNNHRNYAVVMAVCNNVVYQDSVWHNTRHIISTGGMQKSSENIRYGTPRNCAARRLDAHVSGNNFNNANSAFSSMDLHAEGWGFLLENCRVFLNLYYDGTGGEESGHGFSTRARNTHFKNCHVYSNISQLQPGSPSQWSGWYKNVDKAFRIMANDALIEGAYVDGCWRGVWIREDIESIAFKPQRTRIRRSIFKDVSGPIVQADVSGINGVEVYDNEAINSAHYYATGDPNIPSALIILRVGTGHKVRRNYLERYNNNYSFYCGDRVATDVEIRENFLLGYTSHFGGGANKIGIRGDAGDPNSANEATAASFQSAYSALNITS